MRDVPAVFRGHVASLESVDGMQECLLQRGRASAGEPVRESASAVLWNGYAERARIVQGPVAREQRDEIPIVAEELTPRQFLQRHLFVGARPPSQLRLERVNERVASEDAGHPPAVAIKTNVKLSAESPE